MNNRAQAHCIWATELHAKLFYCPCIVCNVHVVYKENGFGYMAIVRQLSVNSMGDARWEVQGTVNYILNGDVSSLANQNHF